jgi:hypothetical protein
MYRENVSIDFILLTDALGEYSKQNLKSRNGMRKLIELAILRVRALSMILRKEYIYYQLLQKRVKIWDNSKLKHTGISLTKSRLSTS